MKHPDGRVTVEKISMCWKYREGVKLQANFASAVFAARTRSPV